MFNLSVLKQLAHTGVIILLAVCALANFYRNRDPYHEYFQSHTDKYLTTHLVESSDINQNDCLEYRLRNKATSAFFRAINEYYKNKQLIVPNNFFFDVNTLAENTGEKIIVQSNQPRIPEEAIESLLRQGKYSFFYSPLFFSTLKKDALLFENDSSQESCLVYQSPWKKGTFPLLMILLTDGSANDLNIQVLHHGKYLFFIPSRHPILESKS